MDIVEQLRVEEGEMLLTLVDRQGVVFLDRARQSRANGSRARVDEMAIGILLERVDVPKYRLWSSKRSSMPRSKKREEEDDDEGDGA